MLPASFLGASTANYSANAPARQVIPPPTTAESSAGMLLVNQPRRFGELNRMYYQDRLADMWQTMNLVRIRLDNARDAIRNNQRDAYFPLEQMNWSVRILEEAAYDLRRLASNYRDDLLYRA
jgi:hypothetical protein